ncbi:MAG: hypothetical protein GW903_04710 [Alphaproteobacteria bacterium]|nr:hypothetical protein [Alphaproteobacteria bacterium]NCQ88271.1 hypothetical protein [Alphaproteobacteria bacterium]NCT05222.1 hypothetical protein [Alphaproteobacteria bacterium]
MSIHDPNRLKSNDNTVFKNITLPLPPASKGAHDHHNPEMEIYARFMRHLRMVPHSHPDIKVLSAIQFTADMLDLRDALVTKVLVDCGLRAPRKALPDEYLEHADNALLRSGWDIGGPTVSLIALKAFWDKIGEDKLAAYRRPPIFHEEGMFVE